MDRRIAVITFLIVWVHIVALGVIYDSNILYLIPCHLMCGGVLGFIMGANPHKG